MKSQKKKVLLSLALSLLMLVGGYGLVKAQDTPSDSADAPMRSQSGMMENCPMMQGGEQDSEMMMMMQRMTDDPVKRSVMQVYMLPALRNSLNLTGRQAARLEDAKQQFTEQRAETQERLKAKEEQLREALSGEQPDLERVRALLSGRAALEADRQMAALRAATQMKDVLSEAQREKLASLKPMQMHRAMMRSMSMMDMMQMMGDMQMQCPMMGGGMPMMQGGGMMSMMENCPMMQGGMQNMNSSE